MSEKNSKATGSTSLNAQMLRLAAIGISAALLASQAACGAGSNGSVGGTEVETQEATGNAFGIQAEAEDEVVATTKDETMNRTEAEAAETDVAEADDLDGTTEGSSSGSGSSENAASSSAGSSSSVSGGDPSSSSNSSGGSSGSSSGSSSPSNKGTASSGGSSSESASSSGSSINNKGTSSGNSGSNSSSISLGGSPSGSNSLSSNGSSSSSEANGNSGNSSGSSSSGSSGTSSGSSSSSTESSSGVSDSSDDEDEYPAIDVSQYPVTVEAYASHEFVDYVNRYRTDMGMDELAWSEALEDQCLIRAEELVEDFSRVSASGSNPSDCTECRLKSATDSVETWYDLWLGSYKSVFLSESCASAACAVCRVGTPIIWYREDGTPWYFNGYTYEYYVVLHAQ